MKISRKLSWGTSFSIASVVGLAFGFFTLKEYELSYYRMSDQLTEMRQQLLLAEQLQQQLGLDQKTETVAIDERLNEARVHFYSIQSHSVLTDQVMAVSATGKILDRYDRTSQRLNKASRFLADEIQPIRTLFTELLQTYPDGDQAPSRTAYGALRNRAFETMKKLEGLLTRSAFTERSVNTLRSEIRETISKCQNDQEALDRLGKRGSGENRKMARAISNSLTYALKEIQSRSSALVSLSAHRRSILEELAQHRESLDLQTLNLDRILSRTKIQKAQENFIVMASATGVAGVLLLLMLSGFRVSILRSITDLQNQIRSALSTQPRSKVSIKEASELQGVAILVNQLISEGNELERKTSELNHQKTLEKKTSQISEELQNSIASATEKSQKIERILKRSTLPSLMEANQLVAKNLDRIGDYLSNDPKGKNLPEFFVSIGSLLEDERSLLIKETQALHSSIEDLKSRSQLKNTYQARELKGNSSKDRVLLKSIIQDVLELQREEFKSENIKTKIRIASGNRSIAHDQRDKVFNVLDRLVRNARLSMSQTPATHREVQITLEQNSADDTQLDVRDSGHGFGEELLPRLFSKSRIYPLDSDAEALTLADCKRILNEKGLLLKARSDGEGRGATFSILFPEEQPTAFQESEESIAKNGLAPPIPPSTSA